MSEKRSLRTQKNKVLIRFRQVDNKLQLCYSLLAVHSTYI